MRWLIVATFCIFAFPLVSFAATLSLGAKGSAVTALQQRLMTLGYLDASKMTGYFGPFTEAAVKQFQQKNNIVSSGTPTTTGYGMVGPRTRAALLASPVFTQATTLTDSQVQAILSLLSSFGADNATIANVNAALGGTPTIASTCTPLSPQTQTLACPTGQTGSITQTRTSTCAMGATTPTWGGWATTASTCSTPSETASCTLDRVTVAHGSSRTFYSDALISYGDSCTNYAQSRTCTNGTLSGSATYQYSSCAVGDPNACSFNNQSVAHGASVTAYQSSSVPFGSQCASQTRTCSNGTLSGSNQYASCSVSQSQEGAFTFSSPYGDCQQGSGAYCSHSVVYDPSNGTRILDKDVILTSISLNIPNLPKGSLQETCIEIWRDIAPVYPGFIGGYSDIMCWRAERPDHAQGWSATIDLHDTPLYFPAGSVMTCGGNLGGMGTNIITPVQAAATNFNCTIGYKDYVPGTPRYRILRLPYFDMLDNPDGTLPISYYIGSTLAPLHVRGAEVYRASNQSSSLCLRWLHQGGAIVQQACSPDITVTPGQNFDSPSFMSGIDWTIPSPDLLTAVDQQETRGDAALYALVEIPPMLKSGPENIFRDYQNVPMNYYPTFCSQYLSVLRESGWSSSQCGGVSCSDQALINACMNVFPQASCLATNSCSIP